MTHWKISEGNIDVIKGKEDKNRHLMTTVNFYKDKISEMKAEFNEELFEEKRQFEERTDPDNGEKWRDFKTLSRKELINEVDTSGNPAFEETMLIDTIRAMRRDRKEQARLRSKEAKSQLSDDE